MHKRDNFIVRAYMAENDRKTDNQDRVQSFLVLHSACQHRIYGFIMSLIGDWNQADDIFQETTSTLWQKFDQFVPGTDFLSWALKIAHFQVLSHTKKKNTQQKHFSPQTLENITEIAISSTKDSDISLEALRECMKKLSERSKMLLSLRYEDGATVQKVAQRVQQSVHTLYREYQKIHTQLFQCIRKRMAWSQ